MNRKSTAFSMIELLVVIAIISTLCVFGMSLSQGLVGSGELSGMVKACEGLVSQSREIATQTGGKARLLILREGEGRYQTLCIVREVRNSEGKLYSNADEPAKFERASPLFLLRSGIYFLSEESNFLREMSFDRSQASPQDGHSGPAWIFLEFDADGSLVDQPGNFFVGRGQISSQNVDRRDGKENIAGFYISRSGGIIPLDETSLHEK